MSEEQREPAPSTDMSEDQTVETTLEWDDAAESTLAALCRMVPETLRQLAEATARDESELAAADRGATAVTTEDVVNGWIRTTPPEQRDGLVAIIEELGFEPERFADALESEEGWSEEES